MTITTITSARVRSFLIILLVAQCINASAFVGIDVGYRKLSNWMFQQYTAPF